MSGTGIEYVDFDGIRTDKDWNLDLLSVRIAPPEIKSKTIDIPGLDGVIDLSSIFGDIRYQNREIEYVFSAFCDYPGWPDTVSQISNYLHGQKRKAINGFDRSFYWEGRFSIDSEKTDPALQQMTITGNVDPYKYDVEDGSGPWKWDPFSFRTGIIRNYSNRQINGTGTVTITGRRKQVNPTIITDAAMTVECEGTAVNLQPGATVVYELQLGEGRHDLNFTGFGTATVLYRGGSL